MCISFLIISEKENVKTAFPFYKTEKSVICFLLILEYHLCVSDLQFQKFI